MEEGCSYASDATNSANKAEASKFLANLPSRGLFSSTVTSSNMGGIRVYISGRDTSAPEHQVIKTDQMNILIRSLTLKKQKGDTKGVILAEGSRKRVFERSADGRASAKRATTNTQNVSQQEASNNRASDNFQSLTVERLRALLKERGLPTKGKKDELISKLRSAKN
ncbi:hypothetical protein Nepgr_033315 [Nepenthes gracilis]|uniref:SAP domain-containing protein n=1 Tax=Nepenthes gracilis TaxID=150966 RepID=A0AAD3TMG0_NEPGR|nr:hypothetical protein Nepgr_033315 [Nepenthes gracilis]